MSGSIEGVVREGVWSTLCRDRYELKSLSLMKLGLGLALGRELWLI